MCKHERDDYQLLLLSLFALIILCQLFIVHMGNMHQFGEQNNGYNAIRNSRDNAKLNEEKRKTFNESTDKKNGERKEEKSPIWQSKKKKWRISHIFHFTLTDSLPNWCFYFSWWMLSISFPFHSFFRSVSLISILLLRTRNRWTVKKEKGIWKIFTAWFNIFPQSNYSLGLGYVSNFVAI